MKPDLHPILLNSQTSRILRRVEHYPRDTQLVVFHISFPMGYEDNAPYFYMATEMVSELANEAIYQRELAREHLLEMAAEARAADVTCLEFASQIGFNRKVSCLTYFYLTRFPTAKSEFQTRFETRLRYFYHTIFL